MQLRLGLTLELDFQCVSNSPVKHFTCENQVLDTQSSASENQGQILGIRELVTVTEEITQYSHVLIYAFMTPNPSVFHTIHFEN